MLTRIKLLMLDSLGCALYGAEPRMEPHPAEAARRTRHHAACAVWGTRQKLSAPHAALVNGTQVQGFELDDVHRQGVLHVGAVVLPALISIAEMRPGMSGKEFLTAAVAGYEIGPRVGICMGPEHIAQGWHSGATLGVFSAAAGAARGLKLDADKTVHALGIAGTQAAGLMAAQYGAMVKRMHAGRSSQSGLYGALLRRRRLHRHRQRVRERIRRLLHDVLAFDRPLQARRTHRRLRLGVADHGRRAEVLFVRRQQPHHARCDPADAAGAPVRRRRRGEDRRAWLAGDGGPRRLEVRAAGPHLRAAQSAVLRGDLAARRRLLRRPVHRRQSGRSGAHGARGESRSACNTTR